jgi:hypothetical protein
MIFGTPLAFAQPLILATLLGLPALWWLLRLIPPRPQRISFPPTRLLFDVAPKEQTPARTPWWLIALRLLLAALIIIAAAGPLWNPPIGATAGKGPVALLIDDGWSAASAWDARMRAARDFVARAEADNRGVVVVPLSQSIRDYSVQTASAADVQLQRLTPQPYSINRIEALGSLGRLAATSGIEFVWLCDGIDLGRGTEFVEGLRKLAQQAPLTVVAGGLPQPLALRGAENNAGALTVDVVRAAGGSEQPGVVRALDLKGLPLGEAQFLLPSNATQTTARFDLPVEIRNDIAELEVASEHSGGAVQLLDKRWRRRAVGIVSGTSADTAQPLLAASYYLSRALGPFADIRLAERGSPTEEIPKLVTQRVPVMVLADVGNLAGDAADKLAAWVDGGGVLIRFAGPRLAASEDELLPVRLRRGGRVLGGSLSWDQPQPLGSFSHDGPFASLPIPGDVMVSRQVLAEPDTMLSDRTWAALADGTPLVTAARRGKGLIVLFHVTADTRWSNLPLSGTFVDMLKQIVSLAGLQPESETERSKSISTDMLPPARILDGFGTLREPPPTARPVAADFGKRATADNPPGFYGAAESMLAVNALTRNDMPKPLDLSSLNGMIEPYRSSEPVDLRGPVFGAGLVLLMLDVLLVFLLAGGIARLWPRRGVAVLALLALGGAWPLPDARAQDAATQFAMKATAETHLAYVITGEADVDAISRAGLQGLGLYLGQRTALEPGEPIGVRIDSDDLSFFPLIYWPISPSAPKPSAEALARIDGYMKQGGTVLFDTRDAVLAPPGPNGETRSPGMAALRTILSSLDIPELEPVPREHVLTKTFYLLREFPGRFTTGQLWVEALPPESDAEENARPARGGDGVSSIIITSNDFAGAWAIRNDGQPMLPLVPGEPRQREFAYRAGVNIVMYTLTGNYKADQVHVPALLERLGQ